MTVEAATLPELVARAAARFGERPAIADGARTIHFGQLANMVAEVARGLVALGIGPGDRVALWAPNGWQWEVVALGVHAAGAILVPLNTRWKGREAAYVLARSRARLLVTTVAFRGTDYPALLAEADTPLPSLREVVILDGPARAGQRGWDDLLAAAARVPPAAAAASAAAVRPDDVCDLIFTAGTTGAPKGVVSTHAQTLRAFRTWSEVVGLDEHDRYLVVNPYFHTFGYKAGWLACLMTGALCLPLPLFDAPAVLGQVTNMRVTVLPGPPTLYQSLLHHPARAAHDLSSLRLAVTGAAVIPVELVQRMREELGFRTVLTAYGLTEATGVVTMCRRDDDLATIAATSGRAIPDVEVRVVDGDGVTCAAGQPGEVRVRGYNVMRGYWEDPDATAAAVDGGGWLHTGDVGVMDARGNLRITDRLKDMFIVGGFNAYPAEIEDLLLSHPAIAQAAVVGVPDARLGEVGYAFVVLRPGARATPDELSCWSRDQMANYKAPRYVEIVPELPLSAVGKVLKYQLRAAAARRVAAG